MNPGKIYRVPSKANFNHPNGPDVLYKYQAVTARSISNLKAGKLWSSFPKSFNDPFECKNNVIGEPGETDWDGLYKKVDGYSIVCLTEIPDDLLMWAHYASSHTGFCMGFKIAHLTNKVLYSNDYPTLDFTKEKTAQILDWYRIIHSKSEQWKYEREYRMIFVEEGEALREYPGELTSLIFGARMSDKEKAQIREILRDSATYYQAELSNTSYKISINRLN